MIDIGYSITELITHSSICQKVPTVCHAQCRDNTMRTMNRLQDPDLQDSIVQDKGRHFSTICDEVCDMGGQGTERKGI